MFPPQHSIRLHCGVENTTQYRPFTTQRCIALHGAPLLYSGHTPDTGAPDPLPKPRNAKLESATARRKLALRKKPYYVRLSPGIALGYRRNAGEAHGRCGWPTAVPIGLRRSRSLMISKARARRTSFRIGKSSTLPAWS